MASFTLDDIRAAAEAKYGSTDIETSKGTVSLVNPLRLPKAKREALMSIQERLEAGEDQQDLLEESLRLVAATKAQGDSLVKEIGGDLTVLVEVFTAYNESAQVGEA